MFGGRTAEKEKPSPVEKAENSNLPGQGLSDYGIICKSAAATETIIKKQLCPPCVQQDGHFNILFQTLIFPSTSPTFSWRTSVARLSYEVESRLISTRFFPRK